MWSLLLGIFALIASSDPKAASIFLVSFGFLIAPQRTIAVASVPLFVAFRAIIVFLFLRPNDSRALLLFFGGAALTFALYRVLASRIETESKEFRIYDRNGITVSQLIMACAGLFFSLFLYLGSVRVAASL